MKLRTLASALCAAITSVIFTITFGSSNADATVTASNTTMVPGAITWLTPTEYDSLSGYYSGTTYDSVIIPSGETPTGVFFTATGTPESTSIDGVYTAATFAASWFAGLGAHTLPYTFTYDPVDDRYENNTPAAIAAFSYSASAESQLTWAISGLGANHAITGIGVTVVPEPSVAVLGGIGVLSLLHRRRN